MFRLDGQTRVLGIIGDPVEQVKAPYPLTQRLQQRGLNAVLVPLWVQAGDVESLLDSLLAVRNFAGLIVTIPHKSLAAGLVQSRTQVADDARAVNLIRKSTISGKTAWHGDLSDGTGFVAGLRANGVNVSGTCVAIAGAGGAGNAIAIALAAAGARHVAVADPDTPKQEALLSRLRALGYSAFAWDGRSGADLMVNATPLGMRASDELPMALDAIGPGVTVAEVIMQPETTALLHMARKRGARIVRGHHMLDEQLNHMVEFFGQAIREIA
jgi:shikimate dehydrogenase